MPDDGAFKIDLGGLRTKPKDTDNAKIAVSDAIGDEHGFIQREAGSRRGRRPSPRTGQLHVKVFPQVSNEIADEAQRRGVTQGVVIEEAWELYKSGK